MTDVAGIMAAKGIRKLFGFGCRRHHHRRAHFHPHALYNTVPSRYRDDLTSKPIQSAVMYGSTMNNSHSLLSVKNHISRTMCMEWVVYT